MASKKKPAAEQGDAGMNAGNHWEGEKVGRK